MRLNFSASWIFRGWITRLILVSLYTQTGLAKSCLQHEYEHNGECCSKCEPGKYVFDHCTGSSDTTCRDCGRDEYQPDWSGDKKCIPQKFCDEGKGFNRTRRHNPIAAEPCRCKQGFHCSLINCEYCEAIEKCPAGEGIVIRDSGRASCVPCQYGFFSDSSSIEVCRKWTDCKAIGKTEKQPGSSKTDVVCGVPSHGSMTPWVVVAILSVIIMVSLVVLFLFCCKDKMNFFSVNLRTCVQNLKGSRNQQETVIPSYHCLNGPPTCPLICQEKTPPECPSTCPSTTLTINDETTCTEQEQEQDPADSSSGSPSEDSVSGPASPLSGSSCSCVLSKEPIEVGENEDCSQLVPTDPATCCSCRTGDAAGTSAGNVQVVSLKESLLCENCSSEDLTACGASAQCDYEALQRSQDLYLDYSSPAGKETMSEVRGFYDNRGPVEGHYRQNEPCCCSIDSTTIPPLPSVSDNDQGLSLVDGNENKLSDRDADQEYQNQCSESALTSGQVTGNNNTTFISNGQVMNFSGEVIVVYVSQTSLGSGGATEEPFSCPVQEESNEDSLQNEPKSNISTSLQGKNRVVPSQRHLPVQEVTNDYLQDWK